MLRALGMLVLLCATAAADPTLELSITGTPPQIQAHVRGAAKPSHVALRERDGGSGLVDANTARGFLEGGPVAVAFVVSGSEIAFGGSNFNDEYRGEKFDLLTPLSNALSRLSLGSLLQAGSEVAIITYSAGAEVKSPWAPATTFYGTSLGTQTDYRGKEGADFVLGVDLGFAELAKRSERRKVLIVIGDGSDTNMNEAGMNLKTLAEAHTDVAVAALVIKSPVSPDDDVIDDLTTNVSRGAALDVEASLKKAFELATGQFDATFDVAKWPQDGLSHGFTLVADSVDLASARLDMPKPPPTKSPAWQMWRWLVLGGVVAAFALMSKLMFRSR